MSVMSHETAFQHEKLVSFMIIIYIGRRQLLIGFHLSKKALTLCEINVLNVM